MDSALEGAVYVVVDSLLSRGGLPATLYTGRSAEASIHNLEIRPK